MKKEMQKWLCGMSALAVCVILTGCGHEHTWTDATCTAPKTCTECGETEGEVLEHTWVEATCAEPKHCSVCGEMEGEALEHTWTEATYWAAQTCSECGATEGEPVTPSFVEHGVSVMDVTVGTEYDYVTVCSEDESKETIGKLTITDYQIADTYEGYETPEGYEWRILKTSILYSDENAWNYGATCTTLSEDYYECDFEKELEESSEDVYTISYLGDEYAECLMVWDRQWSPWVNKEKTVEWIHAFRVPKGYDGCVVGWMNHKNYAAGNLNLNGMLDEDSLIFRLK